MIDEFSPSVLAEKAIEGALYATEKIGDKVLGALDSARSRQNLNKELRDLWNNFGGPRDVLAKRSDGELRHYLDGLNKVAEKFRKSLSQNPLSERLKELDIAKLFKENDQTKFLEIVGSTGLIDLEKEKEMILEFADSKGLSEVVENEISRISALLEERMKATS